MDDLDGNIRSNFQLLIAWATVMGMHQSDTDCFASMKRSAKEEQGGGDGAAFKSNVEGNGLLGCNYALHARRPHHRPVSPACELCTHPYSTPANEQ